MNYQCKASIVTLLANQANSVSPPISLSSGFFLKFFLFFFAINLTEPVTFPTNAKPWKSVRAFWSYSVRKENPTYFYIIDSLPK
uniref:SFRICE_026078 n=1 Tax=Spodoptera frugiperda TaxID=7108 RepID=A0A2H1VLB6_SPOFR